MRINKKLLPLKAHFFLIGGGSAAVLPYFPVIAKGLGFSSVAVGWIVTAAFIFTVLIKPLVGSLADKFSCQKLIFLVVLLMHAALLFSFQWAPSLPTSNSVALTCGDNISVTTCSEKLKEECYSEKVIHSLNSSMTCKLYSPQKNSSVLHTDMKAYYENDKSSTPIYSVASSVHLDSAVIKDTCISMKLSNLSIQSLNWSSICEHEGTSMELICNNEVLQGLIKKTKVDDSGVVLTHQFWIMFIIVVITRVSGSIANSFADVLCFDLLGDKPENYGVQRMFGGIGWGLLSIIVGYLVDSNSRSQAGDSYSTPFYIALILLLLDLLIVIFIKVTPQNKSKSIMKDVKYLFLNAKNIIFLVWCIIGGIYTSFVWFYLFWFIEDLASANGCESTRIKTLEGLVLAIHCYGGEIPFFFLSGRILNKIGHINAMTLVLFTFGVRFLLYSSLTDPWWILPIEPLNGITFGIFYATLTTYASSISPPGTESTVQNLVGAIFEGAGTSAGALLGGYMIKVIGSTQTFLILGISSVTFAVLHVILQNIFRTDKTDFYSGVNMKPEKEYEAETAH